MTDTSLPSPAAPVHRNMILAIACLGQFMVVLDVAIVNVALPAMRQELEFSATGLQWVVNAYTLAFAGLLLLGGRTADLFGRRRMFLVGLGVFTAASLVCGLALNPGALVAARAAQGLGAAILAPVTLSIVTTTFVQPHERSRALGLWSAALASGGAVGVLLGGILTDLLSWRWIFLVNIPVGIAGIIIGRMVVPEGRAEKRLSLDIAGALAITAALSSLVFGIVETTNHGWVSPITLGPIVAAVVLGVVFVVIETRMASAPIAPLGILRSRALTGANISLACVGGSMFAMWYFMSLYLQEVLGLTPLQAGLGFIPASLGVIVGSQFAGRLVPRTGPRPVLVVAGLVISGSLFWMSRMSADGSYFGDVFGPITVVSLGLGASFPPGVFAAMSSVRPAESGLASGLVNSSRQIGGAIGLAALATIAAHRTGALGAGETAAEALADGYARAIAIGSIIALGTAVTAFIIPGGRPHFTPTTPAPAEESDGV
ncbi:MAG: MFS transporter [Thermoleophilia bacterium]